MRINFLRRSFSKIVKNSRRVKNPEDEFKKYKNNFKIDENFHNLCYIYKNVKETQYQSFKKQVFQFYISTFLDKLNENNKFYIFNLIASILKITFPQLLTKKYMNLLEDEREIKNSCEIQLDLVKIDLVKDLMIEQYFLDNYSIERQELRKLLTNHKSFIDLITNNYQIIEEYGKILDPSDKILKISDVMQFIEKIYKYPYESTKNRYIIEKSKIDELVVEFEKLLKNCREKFEILNILCSIFNQPALPYIYFGSIVESIINSCPNDFEKEFMLFLEKDLKTELRFKMKNKLLHYYNVKKEISLSPGEKYDFIQSKEIEFYQLADKFKNYHWDFLLEIEFHGIKCQIHFYENRIKIYSKNISLKESNTLKAFANKTLKEIRNFNENPQNEKKKIKNFILEGNIVFYDVSSNKIIDYEKKDIKENTEMIELFEFEIGLEDFNKTSNEESQKLKTEIFNPEENDLEIYESLEQEKNLINIKSDFEEETFKNDLYELSDKEVEYIDWMNDDENNTIIEEINFQVKYLENNLEYENFEDIDTYEKIKRIEPINLTEINDDLCENERFYTRFHAYDVLYLNDIQIHSENLEKRKLILYKFFNNFIDEIGVIMGKTIKLSLENISINEIINYYVIAKENNCNIIMLKKMGNFTKYLFGIKSWFKLNIINLNKKRKLNLVPIVGFKKEGEKNINKLIDGIFKDKPNLNEQESEPKDDFTFEYLILALYERNKNQFVSVLKLNDNNNNILLNEAKQNLKKCLINFSPKNYEFPLFVHPDFIFNPFEIWEIEFDSIIPSKDFLTNHDLNYKEVYGIESEIPQDEWKNVTYIGKTLTGIRFIKRLERIDVNIISTLDDFKEIFKESHQENDKRGELI